MVYSLDDFDMTIQIDNFLAPDFCTLLRPSSVLSLICNPDYQWESSLSMLKEVGPHVIIREPMHRRQCRRSNQQTEHRRREILPKQLENRSPTECILHADQNGIPDHE